MSSDIYTPIRTQRRRSLRGLIVLKVRGEDNRGEFFGYAKTISQGGLHISTVSPRALGDEFNITFKVPGGDGDITCRCRVIWQRDYDPDSNHPPGMGIMFLDLDDESREQINDWVTKL